MKSITKIILPITLVSSAAFVIFQIKDQPNTSTIPSTNNSTNSTSTNQNDQLNSNIVFQKLSVLTNRCIGCGKCMRIDPQHFEISNNKAVVISSSNLDSPQLTLAINNCPAQAIDLE